MSNEERQRFQNHLEIQLHQITQNEPQDVVQQQQQQQQQQQPLRIRQSREQPVKFQKSFLDGDLDFVSFQSMTSFQFCSTLIKILLSVIISNKYK